MSKKQKKSEPQTSEPQAEPSAPPSLDVTALYEEAVRLDGELFMVRARDVRTLIEAVVVLTAQKNGIVQAVRSADQEALAGLKLEEVAARVVAALKPAGA